MNSTKKVFVVRAKPHGINREDQFLSGTISIGWPTKESLKGKDREDLEKILEKVKPDITKMSITQVNNFIKIPVGSIILTPSYKNRDIHIFETTEGYSHNPDWSDEKIGNPHTIKAKHIITLERNRFPQIINRALLAAKKTVTNFTKYSNELQKTVNEGAPDTYENNTSESSQNFEAKAEAKQTLKELLQSSDEEIRLQAALALLNNE